MSQFNLPEGFTLTAHTGSMDTPANSLESLKAGFDCGADIAEVDIRFLKDGTPVLSHNSPAEGDKPVTLREAFELISQYPTKKVNLDIKETTNMPELQRMAEEFGITSQLFFTGVETYFVEAVKKGCPKIPYYLNFRIPNIFVYSSIYLNHLVKKVQKVGAMGINLNKAMCTRKLIAAFHRHSLLVSVWTINDLEGAKKYLAMSPDNLTCRNPHEVLPLVR